MMLQIRIAGVDRTDVVDWRSLRLEDAVGERSTLRFGVSDVDGVLDIQEGQPIELLLDGGRVFGGTLDRIERRRPGAGKPHRMLSVECTDWHQVCDRRIVGGVYRATPAGDIVRDLVETCLGAEGIRASNSLPVSQSFEDAGGTHRGDPGEPNSTKTYFTTDWYAATHYNTATIRVMDDGDGCHGSRYVRFEHDGSVGWKGLVCSRSLVPGRWYRVSVQARANQASAAGFSFGYATYSGGQQVYFAWPDGPPVAAGNAGRWTLGYAIFQAAESLGAVYLYGLTDGEDGLLLDYDAIMEEAFLEEPSGPPPSFAVFADGPEVVEAVFNYVPATQALDSLAERVGLSWWVDADRRLHFVERAAYAAPWVLSDDDLVNDLVIVDDRQGYRNRQYVRAGKDLTDPQTEAFKGDGAARTFTVGFPVAVQPTVVVNSVPRTVGIKGVETGCDWYWNKGDAIITQDELGTPLGTADTLEITYQGWFDVVVLTTDEAAIEGRKAAEGGTGWYEAVDDEPYLGSREAAIQSANAKLRRWSKRLKTITFNTHQPGLRPGQILTVNLLGRGLQGEYLIEAAELTYAGAGNWRWDVRAVSGEALGGWTKFFAKMATKGQAFVVRENIREDQVLIRLVQTSGEYEWSEAVVETVWACPSPSTTLYPQATLYPC